MDEILDDDLRGNVEKGRFEFYRNFHNVEEAKKFIQILEEHDILYLFESSQLIIDEAIVGRGLIPKAIIKILPEDFKKINTIIGSQFSKARFSDFKDHYLNLLGDQELSEILEKSDEWSIEDISIAKIILKERGLHISEEEIEALRNDRLAEIRKGKKGDKLWMFFYFLGIVIGIYTSLIFLVAGLGMGYYYAFGKSIDQDGNKYHTFDTQTRFYGRLILFGGIGILLVEVVLFFLLSY